MQDWTEMQYYANKSGDRPVKEFSYRRREHPYYLFRPLLRASRSHKVITYAYSNAPDSPQTPSLMFCMVLHGWGVGDSTQGPMVKHRYLSLWTGDQEDDFVVDTYMRTQKGYFLKYLETKGQKTQRMCENFCEIQDMSLRVSFMSWSVGLKRSCSSHAYREMGVSRQFATHKTNRW